jgi:imidazolonepropionase-like amidohydrolase
MNRPFLAPLMLAACLGWSTAACAVPTLIEGARVFDGEHMLARRSVLIEHGKIVEADFHGRAPAGAIVISGANRTLLPGLIDAHVHAYRFQELPLLFGVTTQVDMFTSVALMQEVTRKMAAGENGRAPDLFSAGTLATVPGGHGTEYGFPIPTLTTPAEAQAFVDARIAEGSHFIKIVLESGYPGRPTPSLDLPTATALIEAAHRRGKLAVVHISRLADARAALEAGADGLVHLFVGGAIAEGDLASLVRLAKERHAFVIPTFSVLESVAGVHPADVLGDGALTDLLNQEQLPVLKASYGRSPMPALLAAPSAVTRALREAGVPLLAGTDAGNTGTQYGISLHHELAALVQAGLTPEEALAAATSVPARAFRLGLRGRIANGYKADLLLVEGDPGRDIGQTRKIVAVWKDGEDVSALRTRQRALVAQEGLGVPKERVRLPANGRISLFSKEKLGSPVGFGWMASNDGFAGGKSTVRLNLLDAEPGAQAALEVSAQVAPGFPFPWAGVAFMPGAAPMQAANLSGAKLIRFKVRGDGKAYRVDMMSTGMTIPANVGFTAGAAWQEVVMPFAAFKGVDASAISMIAFSAGPAVGEYRFQIADVRLMNE